MSVNVPAQLPEARRRSRRGGPELCTISLAVEVVTPILGGGSQTRALDDVDVIRAATVRGHLRFWWRALRGHEFADAKELHVRESELWGRAATDKGGRAAVEVRIDDIAGGQVDDAEIELAKTPGAYALWPARSEKKSQRPPAPRRKPGTRFQLSLLAPGDREGEFRNVLRAWLLFGGYGSRTRRGLGSLRVTKDVTAWLTRNAMRASFDALFDRNLFAPPGKAAVDVPWLAGAALQLGQANGDALKAWTTALDWLKEFRQGTSGGSGNRAREPGTGKPQPNRPSISNWPEADKMRHLEQKTGAHPPRHNEKLAWPRAGFGLPIIGQFQSTARDGSRVDEPGAFELRWRSGGDEHDRLASPLIVKALPLADGTFVPCALWLNRGLPAGAEVGLARAKLGEVDPRSAAPFDRLVAPGDTPQFSALAGKASLLEAFLDWLVAQRRTTVVAP
jgi:CRISPR-associated protein Cmr1